MNIVIPKPVNEILTLLYDNNYDGYLVGQTVRKMVMNEKPKKYIIATNAELEKLLKVYKSYNVEIKGEEHKKLIIHNNKFPMEIINYNTKENTLESYLNSQDFTMNALAFSDEEGLIDFNTGVLDIKEGIIKVNGEEDENIISNPLIILRTMRLAGEYKMRIDIQTVQYMFKNKELLNNVPKEAIREELSKILLVSRCAFYIKKYFDIFLVIIPELSLMENFEQNNPYHIYDVLEHTLVSLKNSASDIYVRLAILFHDIAKPLTYTEDMEGIGHFPNHCKKGAQITREVLNRLKYDKKTINLVSKIVQYHNIIIPENENKLKELLSKFNKEEIEILFKVRQANALGKNPKYLNEVNKVFSDFELVKKVFENKPCLRRKQLKISGKDLIKIGIPQNEIGKSLDKIFKEVLNDNLKNEKKMLIRYATKNLL